MTVFDECLWCAKNCSWCGAAERFLQLSIPEQIRLVYQVSQLRDSSGERLGNWWCDNLEAAVEIALKGKENNRDDKHRDYEQ